MATLIARCYAIYGKSIAHIPFRNYLKLINALHDTQTAMSNPIRDFLESYQLLSIKEMGLLLTATSLKRVKMNEHLIEEGQLIRKVFTVVSGLIRTYVLKSDGTEVTQFIATAGMTAGTYKPVFLKEPSNEFVQVIEDSLLIVFDMDRVDELSQKHTGISRIQEKITKENLVEAVERITFYTAMSPEERFLHLRDNRPELLQRVPQKYLASYLGVTPQSYSRMKARIYEKA